MKTTLQLIAVILIFTTNVFAQAELDTINNSHKANSKTEIRYYYFPNLMAYYDIKTDNYVYKQNDKWIMSEFIDSNYRGYSLNNNFYVAIKDYDGDQPYLLNSEHKQKYPANFSSKHQPRAIAQSY